MGGFDVIVSSELMGLWIVWKVVASVKLWMRVESRPSVDSNVDPPTRVGFLMMRVDDCLARWLRLEMKGRLCELFIFLNN